MVMSDEPSRYEDIPVYPVMGVFPAREANLLLFSDYTSIAAYGIDGKAWQSDRISWDGLRISEVTAKHIKGIAWSAPEGKEVQFLLDITSGRQVGGSRAFP